MVLLELALDVAYYTVKYTGSALYYGGSYLLGYSTASAEEQVKAKEQEEKQRQERRMAVMEKELSDALGLLQRIDREQHQADAKRIEFHERAAGRDDDFAARGRRHSF